MIRVERSQSFPLPVEEGFAYITDTENWHEYWPDFVRLETPGGSSWGAPGDSVTVVVELLGRQTKLMLKLEEFERDALVRYTSYQRGLPSARHERRFRGTATGFDYTVTVSFEPRTGLRGIFDRLLLARAISRALQKTIDNLEARFLLVEGSRRLA
ncbi:MAG: SRPBCC family protein [Gemmatimonadetes bacterium]|nr:SRPBCC family protein [Gemmatimonadota bacterium]